jgi:hypothetical protein
MSSSNNLSKMIAVYRNEHLTEMNKTNSKTSYTYNYIYYIHTSKSRGT